MIYGHCNINKAANKHLERAFKVHSLSNFKIVVFQEVTLKGAAATDLLNIGEQYYLSLFEPANLYNINLKGGNESWDRGVKIALAQTGVKRLRTISEAEKQYWRMVYQYNLDGELIEIFESINQAAAMLGIARASVQRALASTTGWRIKGGYY
jgi:hypothetical protein